MERLKAIISRHKRVITFAIVGIINTSIDFAVFFLVGSVMSVVVAQATGYTAGLICSFFLNKYVTFKNKSKSLRQGFLFLLINIIMMLISMIAIYFFHNILGIQEHIAKLFFVTPITMILNYLSYKYIVFTHIPKGDK